MAAGAANDAGSGKSNDTRHKPSELKQRNKPFKGGGRHASARALKRAAGGRVRAPGASSTATTAAAAGGGGGGAKNRQGSRKARQASARREREQARQASVAEKREWQCSAPQVVLIVPVTPSADAIAAREVLLGACLARRPARDKGGERRACCDDSREAALGDRLDRADDSVVVPNTKPQRRALFRALPADASAEAVLDAGKVADTLVLLHADDETMDARGELRCSLLRSQGLANVMPVSMRSSTAAAVHERHQDEDGDAASATAMDDDAVADVSTRRAQELRRDRAKKLALESLGEEKEMRVHAIDSEHGALGVLRLLCGAKAREVKWRAERPYMEVDCVEAAGDDGEHCRVRLTGWLRGSHAVCADRLLHVTGYGTYVVEQISAADSGRGANEGRGPGSNAGGDDADDASMKTEWGDVSRVVSVRDAQSGEPLESEAEIDSLAGEQTWPEDGDDNDGERMADAERQATQPGRQRQLQQHQRSIPRGWSEYQASWLPAIADEEEDDDEEENDDENDDEDDDDVDEDEDAGTGDIDAQQVASLRKAARDEVLFPDEVDTPFDRPARERFARYRGLKSFRTSPWDPKESLPRDYARIFQFDDFAAARREALAEAAARGERVPAGSRVTFHLVGVEAQSARALVAHHCRNAEEQQQQQRRYHYHPIVATLLHRHENRLTVLQCDVLRTASTTMVAADAPIRSKQTLTFHVGFRRFDARPLFSEHNANSNRHKFERFLQAGRWSMATLYGPVTFPPAPIIVTERESGEVVAHGSLVGADPERIVLKRIVLTGYPMRVQKNRATVRYMFFTPDDVRWFRPVELWSKYGRTGHVVEPLGTHGYMKCVFDAVMHQQDTVCMSLYKRVFPKRVADDANDG